jgi:transposase
VTYKRLESGQFSWPQIRESVMRLSRAQFEALFEGLNWGAGARCGRLNHPVGLRGYTGADQLRFAHGRCY